MSIAIIGVVGTVAAAGTAAYSAHQQGAQAKQAQSQQQAQADAQTARFNDLVNNPVKPPAYIPIDPNQLAKDAVKQDRQAYALSDSDFVARHGQLSDAEKLFEAQTLKDQQGESQLAPAIQNEFARAGLAGSLSSFGDSTGSLAPGSAGEANVARNLGVDIMGFEDRNRQNRQQSLSLAESLFPRRQLGPTGADTTNLWLANNQNQNNYNQQVAGAAAQNQQLQERIASGQAGAAQQGANASAAAVGAAQAAQTQAIASGISGALSGGAKAYGNYSHPPTTGGGGSPAGGGYYQSVNI